MTRYWGENGWMLRAYLDGGERTEWEAIQARLGRPGEASDATEVLWKRRRRRRCPGLPGRPDQPHRGAWCNRIEEHGAESWTERVSQITQEAQKGRTGLCNLALERARSVALGLCPPKTSMTKYATKEETDG